MTNLTEQWKKGELPSGWYYVYLKYLEMFDIAGRSTLYGILERGNGDTIKVLAEVPSYEEWQRVLHYAGKYEFEYTSCVMDYEKLKEENAQLKKWCEEFNALEVAKENTKLKELLKDCKHIMSIEKDFASCHFEKDKLCKLLTKINQVLGEE